MRKRQRRAYEPLAIFPQFLKYDTSRVARVQVERNVQIGARLPENIPLWVVVEDHALAIGASPLSVVYKGSLKSIPCYAAPKLLGGPDWVVHG